MRVTVRVGGQNYSKEEGTEHAAGSSDQAEKNLDGDMGRAWLTTKEQMGYDKLTAIWRKASSLLASFDDELA